LSYDGRKKQIMHKLAELGQVRVQELALGLEVSEETIRRDLERLDREGKLKKVYGGALQVAYGAVEPSIERKHASHVREKQAIGRLAASLVQDGDSILLGNGTTVIEMIRFLQDKHHLTLITHYTPALLTAMELFNGKIIFIGGEIDVGHQSANGPLAHGMLANLKVDKAFISAGGVSVEEGISDYDLEEAEISRLMTQRAQTTVVLADSSKLGRTAFAHIGPLALADTLITDAGCPEEWKRQLAEQQVKLLFAEG